jgi:hypothetical protein
MSSSVLFYTEISSRDGDLRHLMSCSALLIIFIARRPSLMLNILFYALVKLSAVLRIHMFLGLLDPGPFVRGTDPDPDPSIISLKYLKKTLILTVL